MWVQVQDVQFKYKAKCVVRIDVVQLMQLGILSYLQQLRWRNGPIAFLTPGHHLLWKEVLLKKTETLQSEV